MSGSDMERPVRRYASLRQALLRPIKGVVPAVLLGAARLVALVATVSTFAANLRAIRRAQAILIYPDGGFGHTIIAPDWIRRLHPGGGNITFFGTSHDRVRHNRLIAGVWGADKFVWVRQGIMLPYYQAVFDPVWNLRLFQAARRFLTWYVPNTPCYFWAEGLKSATPHPSWLAIDSPFNDLPFEGFHYTLGRARPLPPLHVGEPIRSHVSRALQDRFGSEFRRRCAFFIRHRGEINGADTSSHNRLSPEFDAHIPVIRALNRAGYQVLLTGDATAAAELIAERKGGLVDWRAAGVDRDAFRMFAGTEVDIHIGSLSGGSAFLYVTDIPGLMLNAFPPCDALPRTTVYYKWLFHADGSLASMEELFNGMFKDHQLHGCRLVDNTSEEMVEAVEDFIAHLDARPYGVDPIDLGVEAPLIRAAEARLSPVWLEHYRRQMLAPRERRGGQR
jgi:putative glycosyltransferase (TIGR04372 family)